MNELTRKKLRVRKIMKMPFGKFQDQELQQLDTNYMLWLLSKPSFCSNHPAHRTELRWLLIKRLIEELPNDQVRKLRSRFAGEYAAEIEGLV